jgi:large subunit ribosomal protein L54
VRFFLSRCSGYCLLTQFTAKSKKERRRAAKQQRKLEAKLLASGDLSALQPKIPLTQQSIDLPGNEEGTIEGALKADSKRAELRAALREERRKAIKTANYLKSM